jgi:hypothetical protein
MSLVETKLFRASPRGFEKNPSAREREDAKEGKERGRK